MDLYSQETEPRADGADGAEGAAAPVEEPSGAWLFSRLMLQRFCELDWTAAQVQRAAEHVVATIRRLPGESMDCTARRVLGLDPTLGLHLLSASEAAEAEAAARSTDTAFAREWVEATAARAARSRLISDILAEVPVALTPRSIQGALMMHVDAIARLNMCMIGLNETYSTDPSEAINFLVLIRRTGIAMKLLHVAANLLRQQLLMDQLSERGYAPPVEPSATLVLLAQVVDPETLSMNASTLLENLENPDRVPLTDPSGTMSRAHTAVNATAAGQMPTDPPRSRRPNLMPQLIDFTIGALVEERLARYKGNIYEQIYSEYRGRNYPTCAWKLRQSIEEFLDDLFNRVTTRPFWEVLIAQPGTRRHLLASLQMIRDPLFPELQPDRTWFAFRNGLLHVGYPPRFLPFDGTDEIPYGQITACQFFDIEFRFEEQMERGCHLLMHGTHENFFDMLDLFPTPEIDEILIYQLKPKEIPAAAASAAASAASAASASAAASATSAASPSIRLASRQSEPGAMNKQELVEVIFWNYVLWGRLMHHLNKYDKWGVFPAIIGLGGTGKSVIASVIQSLYPPADVVNMSASGDKFSAASLVGAYLWISTELSPHKMGVDLPTFLSMITGEPVAVRPMNQPWRTLDWTVPGMVFGNFVPATGDAQNQMSRRMILTFFDRAISSRDMDAGLGTRAKRGIDAFIAKCSFCYHLATTLFGNRSLWGVHPDVEGRQILPRYFNRQKLIIKSSSDPLAAILQQKLFFFHPSAERGGRPIEDNTPRRAFSVPVERLRAMMNTYLEEIGQPKLRGRGMGRTSDQELRTTLTAFGLTLYQPSIEGSDLHYMDVPYPNCKWVFGIIEREEFQRLLANGSLVSEGDPDLLEFGQRWSAAEVAAAAARPSSLRSVLEKTHTELDQPFEEPEFDADLEEEADPALEDEDPADDDDDDLDM